MNKFLFQIKSNELYQYLIREVIGSIENQAWFQKPMMRFMF